MFDPNKLWFTSDTHFGHRGILKHQQTRSHFSSLEEMDETLIFNWNSRVKPGDCIFHLGDFFLCSSDRAKSILSRLNGEIHLIEGNHDSNAHTLRKKLASYRQIAEVNVDDPDRKVCIICCHYCMRTWNKSHHGSWHIHGHSHGSLQRPEGPVLDVGVDCHNLSPISYWELKEFMLGRTFPIVDHHK